MPIFHAIVLGVVQGLTEFIPVSSSGHLEAVPWLLGWKDFAGDPRLENTFDVALHLGTLVGCLICLWGDVSRYSKAGVKALTGRGKWTNDAKVSILIIATAVPASLFAVSLESFLLKQGERIGIIATCLIIFGVALWQVDKRAPAKRVVADLSFRHTLGLGLGQCLALFPGASRSGVAITTARSLGYERRGAVRLAFLMGLPIIAGAALFRLVGVVADGMPPDVWPALLIGALASGVTGWLALRTMLNWVHSRSYLGFALYRILFAIVLLGALTAQ